MGVQNVISGSTYLLGNKYWGVPFEGSSFLLRHRNIACAYALLPDKRANIYLVLLMQLQQFTNNAVPADINIHFEAGMIGALGQV